MAERLSPEKKHQMSAKVGTWFDDNHQRVQFPVIESVVEAVTEEISDPAEAVAIAEQVLERAALPKDAPTIVHDTDLGLSGMPRLRFHRPQPQETTSER